VVKNTKHNSVPRAPEEHEPAEDRAVSAPEGSVPQASQTTRWVVLAHLLRPQGRKGEILAELLTDFPERFDERSRVFLAPPGFTGDETGARPAEIAAFWLPVGRNQGRVVLHLAGIDSINDAEPLCGLEVVVPISERHALDEDASYIDDLIGCTLFDLAQPGDPVAVGIVTDVHFATTPDGGRRLEEAAPLLAVETAVGDEVLVPFVKAFLVSLDPAHKRIEMTLPPGLIDVNRP
jgi:16S rRNA processing protein RimM